MLIPLISPDFLSLQGERLLITTPFHGDFLGLLPITMDNKAINLPWRASCHQVDDAFILWRFFDTL